MKSLLIFVIYVDILHKTKCSSVNSLQTTIIQPYGDHIHVTHPSSNKHSPHLVTAPFLTCLKHKCCARSSIFPPCHINIFLSYQGRTEASSYTLCICQTLAHLETKRTPLQDCFQATAEATLPTLVLQKAQARPQNHEMGFAITKLKE